MKIHEIDLCGQRLHLLLNGQALFDLYDIFGTEGFLTDALERSGKEGFEAVCMFLAKLSEQGELWRRWQGMERGPFFPEQWFRVHLAPHDVAPARAAILEAVRLGFAREAEEPHDVDLGLLELQKKTAAAGSNA